MIQTRLSKPKVKYLNKPYNQIRGNMQAIRISDGCSRNCLWCYAPQNKQWFGVPKITKNKVLIYDMNILDHEKGKETLEKLSKLKVNNKLVYYEMICGFDYRHLTKEIIDIIRFGRFGSFNKKTEKYTRRIRIAWDGKLTDQYKIKDCIDLLKKSGFKPFEIMVFMICNHKYVSFKECLQKLDLLKVWGVRVADCYYDNQTKPPYIPIGWKHKEIINFNRICRKHNQIVKFGIDPELKCV